MSELLLRLYAICQHIAGGPFPRPLTIGLRTVRGRQSAISAWLASCEPARFFALMQTQSWRDAA